MGFVFIECMPMYGNVLSGYDLYCGDSDAAILTAQTAVTQNYPDDYPNHLDCLWAISAPPGSNIILTFLDYVVEQCCDRLFIGNFLRSFIFCVSWSGIYSHVYSHST